MNWCMFGACAGCIPIMLAFRENYRRLNIDNATPITEKDKEPEPEDDPEKNFKTPLGSFLSLSHVDDLVNRLKKSKESDI